MIAHFFRLISPFLVLLYRGFVILSARMGISLVGAQMIILRDDTVLLVRPTYRDSWEFPGGGVKRSESPMAAAIRETQEEAGVVVTSAIPVPVLPLRFPAGESHLFLAKAFRDPEVWRPTFEIADRRYFPIDALPVDLSSGEKEALHTLLGPTSPHPSVVV